MEVKHSINEFASLIGEIIRCEVEETDDNFIYKIILPSGERRIASHFQREDPQLILSKKKLTETITELENITSIDEAVIFSETSYEVLVRAESRYSGFLLEIQDDDNSINMTDSENKLTYSLGRPSDQFILYLINTDISYKGLIALSRNYINSDSLWFLDFKEQTCVLDYLKKVIAKERITLRITSNARKSAEQFDELPSAFLFNLTYNIDTALVQQKNFDGLFRTGRIIKSRRSNIGDIDPPRRIYIPDLIHHYQLAVATETPMLEYISYYHIIEHFFESIFNEDLVEQIKNEITDPAFSYKSKWDISGLIKKIAKSVKIRDDNMTFNEQEALCLTLKKYLDIKELIKELDKYDKSLVEYYKQESVKFSDAGEVDLKNNDENTIFKQLSSRIYKNRNSIVHSKESDKEKYTPFGDDKILIKEIPLLRFIAERIIFETSKIL